MQSILVSIVAILAAASIAMPVSMSARQLPGVGGLASPLTTVLQEVGKQVPPAVKQVEDTVEQQKKNSTQPGDSKSKGGLGGLGGLLGGLTGGLGGIWYDKIIALNVVRAAKTDECKTESTSRSRQSPCAQPPP
ncbi:hypothetical protein F5Y19DRAFT_113605 [Xylariaceae sp. FL1651]|nr:hypothetical protein F5Y19DRAFT_113605 [Xylariaceae sp. FL1651]